jgi:VCBS repeat-containing protein
VNANSVATHATTGPVDVVQNGLEGRVYQPNQYNEYWTTIPGHNYFAQGGAAAATFLAQNIDYRNGWNTDTLKNFLTYNGGADGNSLSGYQSSPLDLTYIQLDGYFHQVAGQTYTLFLLSDDGSTLYLNGQMVIYNDGPHGDEYREYTYVAGTTGYVPIEIDYVEAWGGASLRAGVNGHVFAAGEIVPDVPTLTSSATLTFTDAELNDTHTAALSAPSAVWSAGPLSGMASSTAAALNAALAGALSYTLSDSTHTGSGAVALAFSAPATAFEFLAAGETLTVSYDVTVTDNRGASSTQPATFSVVGSNAAPVVQPAAPAQTLTFDDQRDSTQYIDGWLRPYVDDGAFRFDGFSDDPYSGNPDGASFTYAGQGYTPNGADGEIYRQDGAGFSLQQLDLANLWGNGGTVWVYGYYHGSQVASRAFGLDYYYQTITFDSTWDRVDDIRFYGDTEVVYLDNVVLGGVPDISLSERVASTGATTANTGTVAFTFTDTDLSDLHTVSVAAPAVTWSGGTTLPNGLAVALAGALSTTVAHASGTGGGSVTANFSAPDNVFDFLAAGENLTAVYNVTVDDGHGGTSTRSVTVAVSGVNDAPVARPGAATISENAAVTLDVLSDADHGAVLTVTTSSKPLGSSLSVQNGQLVFNPNTAFDYLVAGAQTTVDVTYTISDEHNAQASSVATITVTGEYDAPVARNDDLSSAPRPGFLLNPANGHYYGVTTADGSWTQSSANAAAMGGYLATITSAAENAFIFENIDPTGAWWWIGASDAAVEGQWRWVTGPEAGTQFWQGLYYNGARVGGNYANWQPGSEPNGGTGENHAHMWGGGYWNDWVGNSSTRGIVEIGGRAGDPDQTATTSQTAPYAIDIARLLANDTDADAGDTPSLTAVAGTSAKGAAITFAKGVITYDPTASTTLSALAAGESVIDTFTYTITDSQGLTSTATVSLRVGDANDAPVISAGNTQSHLGGATAISPLATITDVDSLDFNGGSLTVAFTANGTAADQLVIGNQGNGTGQIGVSGNTIKYGGVGIGTFSGGADGTALVVNFGTASKAAVQALLDDVLYANIAGNPSSTARTVTYTLNDGDGVANGGSAVGTATATINVAGSHELLANPSFEAGQTTTNGAFVGFASIPGWHTDSGSAALEIVSAAPGGIKGDGHWLDTQGSPGGIKISQAVDIVAGSHAWLGFSVAAENGTNPSEHLQFFFNNTLVKDIAQADLGPVGDFHQYYVDVVGQDGADVLRVASTGPSNNVGLALDWVHLTQWDLAIA